MKGWVKLPNAILHSGAASEDELLGLYVRILAAVNWKEGWFKRRKIERGQLAFSWRNIQSRLYPMANDEHPAPALNTIRRRMESLQQMGLIRFETVGRRFSVCTVLGVSESDTPTGTDRRRVKKGKKGLVRSVEEVIAFSKTLDPSKYKNADTVTAIHRAERTSHDAQLSILKWCNGQLADIDITFDQRHCRFTETLIESHASYSPELAEWNP